MTTDLMSGVLAGYERLQDKAAAILTFDEPSKLIAFSLILVVLAGLLGGMAAKRLKQPLFLGYILSGVLVGAGYITLFKQQAYDSLQGLADIGVALLLFAMGMEFSKSDLKPIRHFAVWGAAVQVMLTFFCCAAIALTLGMSGATALLFGTAFVSTSTAVIFKTLAAKGRMGTLSSRVMIGLSIVQDLTVLPMVVLICNLQHLHDGLAKATMPLLSGAVFLVFMYFAGGKLINKALKRVAKSNSRELFLLAVTGVGLGVGLVAEIFQLSFSFGAFIAGIVMADSPYGKKALYELSPVRDVFAMLFFVSVGMLLKLDFLFSHFPLILGVMVATSFARTVFLAILSYVFRYRNVIPYAMFFGMFATSEIAFVVIQIGHTQNLFSTDIYNLVLCVVVCSMIFGPLVENLTVPIYRLARKWGLVKDVNTIAMPLPPLHGHVVIAGTGTVARAIASLLRKLNLSYVIIDPEHGSFLEDEKQKLTALYGDPQQEIILRSAGIEDARMFLAIFDTFTGNWTAIRAAQKLRPGIEVLTRCEEEDEVTMLNSIEVYEIVRPKFEAGLEITRQTLLKLKVPALEIQNYLDQVRRDKYRELLGEKTGYRLLSRLRSFLGIVELNWVLLPENGALAGRSLAELKIRSKCGVSVVGIIRDGAFISNPPPSEKLELGDVLGVIGTAEQCKLFEGMAGAVLAATPAGAEAKAAAEIESNTARGVQI